MRLSNLNLKLKNLDSTIMLGWYIKVRSLLEEDISNISVGSLITGTIANWQFCFIQCNNFALNSATAVIKKESFWTRIFKFISKSSTKRSYASVRKLQNLQKISKNFATLHYYASYWKGYNTLKSSQILPEGDHHCESIWLQVCN